MATTNNQFALDINAILNTKDVPKQLSDLNAQLSKSTSSIVTIPVIVNTKNGLTHFKDFIKEVNTYKDKLGNSFREIKIIDPKTGNVFKDTITKVNELSAGIKTLTTETHKWTTSSGEINTWTTSVNTAGETISTRTKQYVTDMNEMVTETEKWTRNSKGQWTQVGETIRNTTDLVKENTSTTQTQQGIVVDTVNGVTNAYKGLITTTQKVSSSGEELTVVTSKYTNELGQTIQKTETFNKAGIQVATTERKISDEALNGAKGVRTFGQSLSDAFARLARYYLASLPIQAVRKAIRETITTIKEFDSALIEFRKVSDLAGESLTNYTQELAKLGELTGSTMTAMVEAATEFRKSGFNDEDSAILASLAEEFRNVADGEITAADSASFIISQMKAFNIEAQDAEHILDAVNNVSNHFAVSSSDLSENIGKVSAALAVNGAKFEEVLGMMTAVTEITRNASTASRGLSMISSRLVQVLDDTSSTGKKLTKIYNDLGIALKDENGQMRGTYDILKDLASQWGTLSGDQQKYIALTSAGARQTQNFVALMENFSQAIKATEMAYNSSGSAAEENAKVMDSVAKKVEILKSQFQQLIIGEGGLQSFAKIILDIGIAFLKFANSDMGKFIAVSAIALVSARALSKSFKDLEKNIILTAKSIQAHILAEQGLIASEIEAQIATIGLSEAFKILGRRLIELTAEFLASPFGIAVATVAAIAGIVAIVDAFTVSLEESTEKLKELNDSIQQDETELENLKNKLEEVRGKIEELNNTELGIVGENQLNELKLQSQELERQIQLKEIQLEQERKLAEAEAKRNLKTGTKSQFDSGDETDSGLVTQQEELIRAEKEYKKLTERIKELNEMQAEAAKTKGIDSAAYKRYTKEIENANNELNKAKARGTEVASSLTSVASNLTSTDDETIKLRKDTLGLVDGWTKLMIKFGEIENPNKMKGLTSSIEEQLKALSAGGNVDLTIRPVIDAEELNKKAYEAGEGAATVFTHTFSNEQEDIAINFTPILTDPTTGEYLGVMDKPQFEKYCQDVVEGVSDDYLHLQIGAEWHGDDAIEKAEEAAEQIHELHQQVINATDGFQTYDEAVEACGEASEEASDMLKEFANNLGISEEELIANAQAAGLSIDAYYQCSMAIKQADAALDEFQSSYQTLSSAIEEYNEKQYLSIDTVQSLLQLQPEYLSMLIDENGQLKLNEQAIVNKCNALIEERKQTALQMAYEKLAAIERGNNQTAAESESSAIDGNTSSLNEETNALSRNTIEQYANRIARNDKSKGTAASQVVRDLEKELAVLDKIGNSYKSISSGAKSAGSAGKSGAKAAKDAQKELNKELQDTLNNYKKVISWISKQYDKEIDKIKKAEDEALKAEEAKIKAKEKEKDNALDVIEKEIKALEKEKKALKDQKEALDEQKQALKDAESAKLDKIEKRIKVLEKERDNLIKPVEARIKALEKERDAIIDATQAEIDSINELKEQRQNYWNEQIDALKKANEELKDNLELQEKLDALEKAKNTKVKIYKEGQGFVYDVDQTAVAEAQKALDEYLSQKAYEDELARLENLKDAEIKNYDDRLKALNDYKDKTKKAYDDQLNDLKEYKEKTKDYYDEQIENLKEYKEKVQEQYEEKIKVLEKDIDALEKHMDKLDKHKDSLEEHKDAVQEAYEAEIEELENHKQAVQDSYESEIETWEGYKQAFEDMVNAYEEQQNRLLFQQLTGITDESNNWMTRLDNLAEFVRKYNELQAQLDTGNTSVSNDASMSSGSSPSSSSYDPKTSTSTRTVSNYSKPSGATNYTPSYNNNYRSSGVSSALSHQGYHGMPTNVKRYASGTDSIKDNEIAIVGENPNKEIILGSKINNGELMSLGKGTGIVNADGSKTLASMLNQVGQFGSSGFGSGNGTLNNNINNDSLVVNGVTIEGSQIKDPETFVNGLLNLKAEALQRAYKHR